MSQIDKVVYLPILIWFWIFFVCLYLFLFSNFLTYIYTVFRVRTFYMNELIVFCCNTFYFSNIFIFFCLDFFNRNYFRNIYIYLKNFWVYTLAFCLPKKFIKF